MGKLRMLPPRLRTLGTKLRTSSDGATRRERERNRDERRRSEQPWRAWYKLTIWDDPETGLRAQQLERQPICETCRCAPATIAHHKRPHQGNWNLFADPNNLESTCKPCHDGAIQRGERAGNWIEEIHLGSGVMVASNLLWPKELRPSRIPLVVISGAPASGKSHLVAQRKSDGDIVIDLDVIVASYPAHRSAATRFAGSICPPH